MTIPQLLAVICLVSLPGGDVHHVGPGGSDSFPGTRDRPFATIARAFDAAAPGDTVVLLPGTYRGPVEVTKSGEPERPITVRGERADGGQAAVIDGGWRGELPKKSDANYGAVLRGRSWITLENLVFRNCWNRAVVVEDGSYVTVRGCRVECAGEMVYATGAGTHHLLVERCTWNPVGRAVWEWPWEEMKTGRHKYLAQGSLLAGETARGHFVIRDNDVGYVFNGFRYAASSAGTFANVEVYRNRFDHVRDNAIEPENFIHNLHVYHNRIDNVSAFAISLDSCRGGPMYLYGNTGRLPAGYVWLVQVERSPE